MPKNPKRKRNSAITVKDSVTVVFAEDIDQAREYKAILQNSDIPAVIRKADTDPVAGIAVMVPEEYLDEAHVLIESQHAYDDFYELAFEQDEADELLDGELTDDAY